jgi:asparagine synthetase B (glutamine-hydrolysing)
MIVGAIGDSDRAVQCIVDRITKALHMPAAFCSVGGRVAIGCWGDGSGSRHLFLGDRAYVGTLRGDFPGPGVELRGDFALVARSQGRLRLACGRFAGRPLYWIRIGQAVVASSRLLPLAFLARPDLKLNVEHLLALFDPKFRLLRAPLPFHGVERVGVNTFVDIDSFGHAEVHAGHVHLEPELTLPTRELASTLQQEFVAAVQRQTAGARRVAVMTGGGVDSSNLLSTAIHNARHNGGPDVIPVALDFGGPGDDRPHLSALCRHLGVEPLRVPPAAGARYAGQERISDASAHATAPLSTVISCHVRAKAAGADLVLLGDGSEYLLDAAPEVFGDFFLKHPLDAVRCVARFQAINRTRLQSWRILLMGPLMRRVLPSFALRARERRLLGRLARSRVSESDWIGPRLTEFLTSRRHYPPTRPIHDQRTRVIQSAGSLLMTILSEVASRWETLVGLRICYPYLDDEYVRFVGRIPSSAIFAGSRERGLLRESMEGLVPDSVRYRMDKSRGDHAFAEAFNAMGGYEAVRDLVAMRELEKLGIVDAKRFRIAFERFAADPFADPSCWGGMLWGAVTAEAYVRWFNDFRMNESPLSLSHLSASVPI